MANNLVTLAEYKAYAGINSTNQDATIESIIPKVSALVKNVCRRTFIDYVDEPREEIFDGGSCFLPAEYPILSATVEVSEDYGDTYTAYSDYYIHKASDSIRPRTLEKFPDLPNGYKVTYTCGFEQVPEDLKVAVLDLVTYYIRNDGAIHSPKAPGTNSVQIEYITTNNLPAHIKRVLDLYTANYL